MVAQVRNYQSGNAVVGAAETVLKILNRGGILYATDMELWENGKFLYSVRYNVVDHLIKTQQLGISADQKRYIPLKGK